MITPRPEQHLAALPLNQQAAIARRVCAILEFGPSTENLDRGQPWHSETPDHIADIFADYDILFTYHTVESLSDCLLCGAPGGYPHCTGTFGGRISCADVAAADTPDHRTGRHQPPPAHSTTRLLHLRRPGGPLAAISYGYDPRNRWHQWISPNGAELRYCPRDGIVEILTSTGEMITLNPATGLRFTLATILRLLGAMQIITPLTGGIRIDA